MTRSLEESQARIAELDAKILRAEAEQRRQDEASREASNTIRELHDRAIAILSEPRPAASTSSGGGWTVDTLKQHFDALRVNDERFYNERDRRYTEVSVEREKALKIKDEADKAALGLAREIQTYKDEKANELREQIGSERGLYPTKSELTASMRELRTELVAMFNTAKADSRWTWERVIPIVLAIGIVVANRVWP